MRKLLVLALLALCLSGCGEAEVFETVGDTAVQSAMAVPKEIRLELPEDTVLPVMETDSGTLYMCQNFDVMVQTLESGDLAETVRQISGQEIADLTVITKARGDADCYEFVWTAAGDTGEQVSRCMIIDDGDYHYVLTAMTDAEKVYEYQEIWNGMFETFELS